MPQTGTTSVNGSFRPGVVDGSNGPADTFETFVRSVGGLYNIAGPIITPLDPYDQVYTFVVPDVPVWSTDQPAVVDVKAINTSGFNVATSLAFIIQGELDPPAAPIEVTGSVVG